MTQVKMKQNYHLMVTQLNESYEEMVKLLSEMLKHDLSQWSFY